MISVNFLPTMHRGVKGTIGIVVSGSALIFGLRHDMPKCVHERQGHDHHAKAV